MFVTIILLTALVMIHADTTVRRDLLGHGLAARSVVHNQQEICAWHVGDLIVGLTPVRAVPADPDAVGTCPLILKVPLVQIKHPATFDDFLLDYVICFDVC